MSTKPPTTPPATRAKPAALSVVNGGAEAGELKPEPTRAELLLEHYESRTFSGSSVLGALPRPEWLIRGLLLRDSVAAIYGQKGQGKTHYTLGMSLEVARGGEWNGRKLRASPVLYLVGEGSSSFVERLEAWEEHHGTKVPDLFHSAHIEPAPQLIEGDEMKAFSELVLKSFGKYRNGLIVLDTFQTATVGLDEISGRDMTVAIEAIQTLRRATGSTVVIVHHAGKNLERGQRGHSSLGASMETELEISKEATSPNVTAKLVKMRAAADGGERKYRLNYVALKPTQEDIVEAAELGLPAEMRSVPVISEQESASSPFVARHEKILLRMLESFDLPDGLKRTDVERELNLKRSQTGLVLQELLKKDYVTNESPFSGRKSTGAYWLTANGRSVAERVRERNVAALIEQTSSGTQEEF